MSATQTTADIDAEVRASKVIWSLLSGGTDLTEQPYLALLANLTPADLELYAKPGGLSGMLHAKYRVWFPALPERSRLQRLLRDHAEDVSPFLADPSFFMLVDTYGIELIHPRREGRSKRLSWQERQIEPAAHRTQTLTRRVCHLTTSTNGYYNRAGEETDAQNRLLNIPQ
jgi:hypothetical protein